MALDVGRAVATASTRGYYVHYLGSVTFIIKTLKIVLQSPVSKRQLEIK